MSPCIKGLLNKMDLVIDANILMSALIASGGGTYDLIFNERIKLFAPEFLIEELNKHKEEILLKSQLEPVDFELFLSLISSKIEFVPYFEFEEFITNATEITPDPNDCEYFALGLKLDCGLWSNDKEFKKQKSLKVYTTKELMVFLGVTK